MSGKYVFGDLGGASGELTNGRLFYTNLSSGNIREFRGAGENLLKGFLKGFGTDASNEIYVLIDMIFIRHRWIGLEDFRGNELVNSGKASWLG